MLKTLTTVLLFSILWFCVIVAIGERTHNPYVRDSLPLVYLGGNAIYVVVLLFIKTWRK